MKRIQGVLWGGRLRGKGLKMYGGEGEEEDKGRMEEMKRGRRGRGMGGGGRREEQDGGGGGGGGEKRIICPKIFLLCYVPLCL